MAQLTQEWIDRQRHIAENTWVAETASGVIVISHPGQRKPDPKDRKFLRENFGLLPEVEVKPLIDTVHAPPLERLERELALQDSPLAERMAYHRREFIKLALEESASMGLTVTPAVARAADAELDEELARAQADTGDLASAEDGHEAVAGGDDGEEKVSTVGGGRGRRPGTSKE